MIHNFESWRKAKQSAFVAIAHDMHYHRCSDTAYRLITSLLQGLVNTWLNNGRSFVSVRFTEEQINVILEFLDEMEFAYIHPRSTSHRIHLMFQEKSSALPVKY